MPSLTITRHDILRDASFHLAEAAISWDEGDTTQGWGRDRTPETATARAVSEAIERHGFRQLPPHRVARAADVFPIVHPHRLVRYEPWQYGQPGIGWAPFDSEHVGRWAPARTLSGDVVHVLAEFTCSPGAFPTDERQRLVTWATTSGCATASTLDHAILNATFELIERDAFMRHWFAQRPGLAVPLDALDDSLRRRLDFLRGQGCRAGVQWLDLGVYPTWLAWAQHPMLTFTCVGAATGLDRESALDAAIAEMETVALARLGGVPRQTMAAADVQTPADHAAWYATSGHFRNADALLDPIGASTVEAPPFSNSAQAVYDRLEQAGHRLYWLELGDEETRLGPDGAAVHTVRALATGLIPMSFGQHRLPLGMDTWKQAGARSIHPFS